MDKVSHGNIIEYKWPSSNEGEYFMLQSQVAAYLGTSAFNLKYPALSGRLLSKDEKSFLIEKGLITEEESKNDLITLKSEDVVELLVEKFPQKYQEYLQIAHERDRKKIIDDQHSQMVAKNASKMASYVKKAIKDAAEYNSHLNQDRKEERSAYFDMQTQMIQVPRKSQQIISPEKRKRNLYPVALMPGQFQEYFKKYSAEELRSLPLSTVTSMWSSNRSRSLAGERDESQINSDSNTQSSSEDEGDSSDNIANSDSELPPLKRALRDKTGSGFARHRNKHVGIQNDSFCGICLKDEESNKKGVAEELVHCSFCENSGHPSCLEMNKQLVEVIKTYAWQCMECKTCTLCSNPHDEEHMMFCDNCDRGYHSYCAGLKSIPDGRWVCDKCGKCASCLTRQPGPDGTQGKWREEFKKPKDGGESEFLQYHCHKCSKLFRSGNFCPVCLKVYRSDEKDLPMVCCDSCDRWIHTDCDDIDDRRYQELSKDSSAQYKCVICRGEKEERVESFHKESKGSS